MKFRENILLPSSGLMLTETCLSPRLFPMCLSIDQQDTLSYLQPLFYRQLAYVA